MAPAGLQAVFRAARGRLAAAGIAQADLDARVLVEQVTGLTRTDLLTRPDTPVGDEQRLALDAALARRVEGEPVYRIVGWREFHGLRLNLSPDTLEPRPDTETVVDVALEHLRALATAEPRILDLGTGTGAIGLALLAALPAATATLTDVAQGALDAAARNAAELGLSTRCTFVKSDWYQAVRDRFDLIVSNPPYIPAGDIPGLDREVVLHDPARALDGGADGLDAYRRIAAGAADHLAEGGAVCLEIGIGQAADVAALFSGHGFRLVRVVPDLGGLDRALLLKR